MARRNPGIPTPASSAARGPALRITHPNAAGIDIGGASHFVAVPPERDDEPVREFRAFTADLSAFPSGKHFASWLGLAPGTKISGGKKLSGRTLPSSNRAAQALRLAAAALRTSQSALGAYYRRMCARMDKPKAVTAAAHKLARLIYAMLTRGQQYTDQGQAVYEERYRQRVVANLTRRAQQLGLQLVPMPETTTA